MVATRRCLVVLLLTAAACAKPSVPASGAASANGDLPSRPAAKNPNVISRAELHDPIVTGMDGARAIRHLRPAFFRATPPQSLYGQNAGILQLSADYGPLQPVAQLANYRTIDLYEVRYLTPEAAQGRFGLNANGGPVILLLSNKE